MQKRVANKRNAAHSSLLAFWPLVVHLLAYHVERGCRTRVRRRAFDGIFLIVSLKRVADAVPNRPLKGSKKMGNKGGVRTVEGLSDRLPGTVLARAN